MSDATIDIAAVRRAAHLARIAVAEDELPSLAEELERVRVFVAALQAVDVDGVEPLVHPNHEAMPLRADDTAQEGGAASAVLTQQEALANAPAVRDAHFAVPRVVG